MSAAAPMPSATPRLPYQAIAPEHYQRLLGLATALKSSSLGKRLLHLVDLRVSQINGCAFCVDMHGREMLADGDSLQRLNSLVTWREVDLFDARERAALHWAEQLTRLAAAHPAQADYELLLPHFTEREIVDLTLAIGVINTWNRLSVGFATPVAHRALRPGPTA